METVIIIAVIVALVWHAIQRGKQHQGDAAPWLPPMPKGNRPDAEKPGPQTPPRLPAEPPRSWEEELRRLLGDESVQPPPPPVIVRPPPPVSLPAPMPTQGRSRPRSDAMLREGGALTAGRRIAVPSLSRSAEAMRRAGQLEATVTERFHKVDEQLVSHRGVSQSFQASPEIRQAIGLLRARSSQRAAIVAAVVLGPPKALSE